MSHCRLFYFLVVLAVVLSAVGCRRRDADLFYEQPPPPVVLGTHVDEPFEIQERNAEASKFVIYSHEFRLNDNDEEVGDGDVLNGLRMNEDGQDHLRQIAASLRNGSPYAVIVERSRTSERADSRYGYPVNYNAQLDNRRRSVVVNALVRMGIENADEIVVVTPAFAEGLTGREAQRAYRRGMQFNNYGGGAGGFGNNGGFGGFGGIGR